ncbi:F0F1 ATP synthase subunit B [Jeotgalibaca arthritidis]|uniref:ATP synthase subunit b n=1 Tax=Jeotgalibaca arthritidis TaxID=1868794 RepID=A0A6G7K767_9LACT|nr:F0F1 ATP synthase subunit B [Jeotgalibaca arthritidis]QII81104.1 F0F1 ATP synthase subunit B [Jeotgalibaca arthritidis]
MTLGLILGASTTLGDSLVTLISFLLLFVVIKSVAWKPLMNMLAQREEAINADLDKAETARLSAEQQLAEVELQLREARTKANDTLSRAQAEGTEMQRAIVEEAKEDARRIRTQAEKEIDLERKQAFTSLRSEISEMSISIAEGIIGKELNVDDQNRLIEEFIKGLED